MKSIKSKRIKKLLIKHGLDNPTENTLLLAKTAIQLGLRIKDDETVVGREITEVFGIIDRMLSFNIELMDEINVKKNINI